MFIKTPTDGYHFSAKGIARAEELYGAKYLGYWQDKDSSGNWNDVPVDVFYQPNPNKNRGHSHYFGLFKITDGVIITNAESAFSDLITGVVTDDGEVIVSRYRHDYVAKDGCMIDGGRNYLRTNGIGNLVSITMQDGEFKFERIENE